MTTPAQIGIQITFDAADPHALAAFWAAALGYEVEDHSERIRGMLDAGVLPGEAAEEVDGHLRFVEATAASDPTGARPRLYFQRVPEEKVAKNRVHLDLHVGAEAVDAEVERLVGLGAQVLWETADRGPRTITLRDPEGNELCVT